MYHVNWPNGGALRQYRSAGVLSIRRYSERSRIELCVSNTLLRVLQALLGGPRHLGPRGPLLEFMF